MKSFAFLPLSVLKYWYIEAPVSFFIYFRSLNDAFLQLFSLPLFIRTYTRPLKNEYREGLVGFSRALGMGIKTWFIVVDLFFFLILLAIELVIMVLFLSFPLATIVMLFL